MVCPWKPFPVRSYNLRARLEQTQLEDLSDASFFGKLLVLPGNVRLDLKVIARYKHSSLFGLVISNKEKSFITLRPGVCHQRGQGRRRKGCWRGLQGEPGAGGRGSLSASHPQDVRGRRREERSRGFRRIWRTGVENSFLLLRLWRSGILS